VRRRPLLVALAATIALVVTLAAVRDKPTADARSSHVSLPSPLEPALLIPTPRTLAYTGVSSHWATVLQPVVARAEPDPGARPVTELGTTTPEKTTNLVLIVGARVVPDGRVWSHVRLPILPNNSTAWIPRAALGPANVVDTHLVVDRAALRLTLYREGRAVFTAPVGVGAVRWPTPAGEFYVRNRLDGFDDPFYGPVAFGTSARSAVLTDWPAGGYIGIHGTNAPWLIPGRVSHGCIRLRNGDIRRLARLMPVGTPLTVR
jgi:lipoprotein-anchoring transpeptidase ErfK/SrfK